MGTGRRGEAPRDCLLAFFVVHHLVALAVAFVAYAAIELAFCTWIDRHWDGWEAKARPRMRKKIDKWRSGGRVLWTCLAAATAFTIYAAIGIYTILGIARAALGNVNRVDI